MNTSPVPLHAVPANRRPCGREGILPDGAELLSRMPRVLGQAGLRVSAVLIAPISAQTHAGIRRWSFMRDVLAAAIPPEGLAAEMRARR